MIELQSLLIPFPCTLVHIHRRAYIYQIQLSLPNTAIETNQGFYNNAKLQLHRSLTTSRHSTVRHSTCCLPSDRVPLEDPLDLAPRRLKSPASVEAMSKLANRNNIAQRPTPPARARPRRLSRPNAIELSIPSLALRLFGCAQVGHDVAPLPSFHLDLPQLHLSVPFPVCMRERTQHKQYSSKQAHLDFTKALAVDNQHPFAESTPLMSYI